MAFRKRNVALGNSSGDATSTVAPAAVTRSSPPGTRPSALTSHPVTSTGALSFDALLSGHGGLPLGCSLLVEESGTTDFAGALLKYYAAEGICHGHTVVVVGVGEAWVRGLPGIAEEGSSRRAHKSTSDEEKMKIAWRYENLGQAGERAPIIDRAQQAQSGVTTPEAPFCHNFDLTKRLVIPQDARIIHIAVNSGPDPFKDILKRLEQSLQNSSAESIHRLVIPSILSPALYPSHASQPENIIRFLRSLRTLLKQHPTKLTAMLTLPLELYPRPSALIRWAETLTDAVIELTPFPHLMDDSTTTTTSTDPKTTDDQPQGMLNVHKLPIISERGEGGAGPANSIGADLAFTVSRRRFAIEPFSLPPVEGEREAQGEGPKVGGRDVEF